MTNQILQERYEIQRQLGKNTGRKTLLAKDLKTQKLVVVKLLSFDGESNWQDLKLFKREAQILQEVSHPAIPNYLDYFDVDLPDNKGFGLVQTYIPAKSLEEHLESARTFNEAEVKQIAKAVLEVLIHLHSRQPAIIHRDIKPSNILLGDRSGNHIGDVYLIDFGAVKTTQKQGGTMTVVGTYGYMAQEQFGGRAVAASDLYSLGATLIYLVTGNHPADLLGDEMVIEFEESVNLSPDFIKWLKWMTQSTLKKRPISAEAALEGLENPTIFASKFVVSKPLDSKIQLLREKDKLEILSPPVGLSLPVIAISTILFFPSLIIILLFIILIATETNNISEILLFLIIFGPVVGLVLNIWRKIIFNAYGYNCLSINKNKIKIQYQIFGLKILKSRPISKSDIYKLEIVDRTIDNNDEKQQSHLVRLIISAGMGNYELKNFLPEKRRFWQFKIQPPVFTLPEIYWLAKEVSDYLELPVQRNNISIESDNF